MKKLLLTLFIVAPALSMAQAIVLPRDSTTKQISFQEVVQVPGATKDELYTRAREWFAKTFKSSKDVIQMDDRIAGKIIGKGSGNGLTGNILLITSFWLNYTVSITIKDGRYRYEITDFTTEDEPSYSSNRGVLNLDFLIDYKAAKKNDGSYIDMYEGYFQEALSTGTNISKSLKEALAQPAKGIKSKDDF